MSTVTTLNLEEVAKSYDAAASLCARRVVICAGTGCMAGGSMKVFAALQAEAKAQGLNLEIELDFEDKAHKDGLLTKSGCQGFCQVGPLLSIEPDGILYGKVIGAGIDFLVVALLVFLVAKMILKEDKVAKK